MQSQKHVLMYRAFAGGRPIIGYYTGVKDARGAIMGTLQEAEILTHSTAQIVKNHLADYAPLQNGGTLSIWPVEVQSDGFVKIEDHMRQVVPW